MNIKNFLKSLKLNESTISMVLGAIIIAGVSLMVVNYFKKPKTGITLPAEQVSRENNLESTRENSYSVKKGDNLWKIAENAYGSGYYWTDIAEVNNLSHPSLIEEGQVLNLPEVQYEPSSKLVNQTSEKLEAISGATYTVIKGDSLWKISVRAYGDGYKWLEIARENKLTNPNLIHPGNVLSLPQP